MTRHEEVIDLLHKCIILLYALCEEIGADPDDIDVTVKALENGKPGKNISTLNVGDIFRRMNTMFEHHERTAQDQEGTLQ